MSPRPQNQALSSHHGPLTALADDPAARSSSAWHRGSVGILLGNCQMTGRPAIAARLSNGQSDIFIGTHDESLPPHRQPHTYASGAANNSAAISSAAVQRNWKRCMLIAE